MFQICCSESITDITVFTVLTHTDKGGKKSTRPDLENVLQTTDTPRSFEAELYHLDPDGVYSPNADTEKKMLQLWHSLLNENYPIRSNLEIQKKCAETQVVPPIAGDLPL